MERNFGGKTKKSKLIKPRENGKRALKGKK